MNNAAALTPASSIAWRALRRAESWAREDGRAGIGGSFGRRYAPGTTARCRRGLGRMIGLIAKTDSRRPTVYAFEGIIFWGRSPLPERYSGQQHDSARQMLDSRIECVF